MLHELFQTDVGLYSLIALVCTISVGLVVTFVMVKRVLREQD